MSTENDIIILGVCIFIFVSVFVLAHFLKRKDDEELAEVSPAQVAGVDPEKLKVSQTVTLGTEVMEAEEPAHWKQTVLETKWETIPIDDVPAKKSKKSKKDKKSEKNKDAKPYVFSFTKLVKGKLVTRWGCTFCAGKAYKHAPSAYNHIRAKH